MNIPNKLSLLRIILIPIMMFFYLADFVPYGKFIALFVFIVAAITDFLDGYIARKYNLITDLGKFLDSIADKMLVTIALILLCCDGTTIPVVFNSIALSIVVARDLVMNMLRQIGATKNVVISADKLGKYKAFVQYIAISVLFLYAGLNLIEGISSVALTVVMWIGYGTLILSCVLAIISLISYLVKNRAVFKQEK
jgi:CDP-diacylglycerol--glycerol-3-phosphate 3-phosphatidyltransferase